MKQRDSLESELHNYTSLKILVETGDYGPVKMIHGSLRGKVAYYGSEETMPNGEVRYVVYLGYPFKDKPHRVKPENCIYANFHPGASELSLKNPDFARSMGIKTNRYK